MLMMRRFSTATYGNVSLNIFSKKSYFYLLQRVGFIGMGNMGISMAGNLVKNGFVVKGFDLN